MNRARLVALALLASAPVLAAAPPLLPRRLLFGNPERTRPTVSPDGKHLAWLAPDKNDVLQVWLKEAGKEEGRAITADKKRGIRRYSWAYDDRTLLYLQDNDGDENWHLFGVDLESGNVRDYTPFQGVRADILAVEPRHPGTLLVTLNLRDRRLFDVHRIDLASGAVTLDTKNPGDVGSWVTDADLRVLGAEIITPDGGTEVRVRPDGKAPWRSLLRVSREEIVNAVDFTLDGKGLYLISSLGSDTARLVLRDLAGGKDQVIAESPEADAGEVVIHPDRHVPQAVAFERARLAWKVLDPTLQEDFAALAKAEPGDFTILSRDRADRTWTVAYTLDRAPPRFYSFDRVAKKSTFLFSVQPKLDGQPMAPMKAVTIPARDGLPLPAYLTLPEGAPPGPQPLVLLVHGGPWSRDRWGNNPMSQWLQNRGYAVLQVNFRGSTGFGKKFLNAGNRQWGKKMHDDLIDAVNWAVKEKVADPKRVAIFGGSYGGYSALAGAAFTPDTFRCAVDIVGPSSIFTLIRSIPPYWAALRGLFDSRVGNVDDPKDAELLKAASPLFFAERIKIPLLIGQGANDPRVKQAESEQIVAAIEKRRGQAIYVLYPDEGHGFARPENRMDFNARAERFLGACLGGRVEPLPGEREPGSTAVVRVIGK